MDQLAERFFHGHARIIADPLPDAAERTEQRRFARVRVADQGDRPGAAIGGGRIMEPEGIDESACRCILTDRDSQDATAFMRTITCAQSSMRNPSR